MTAALSIWLGVGVVIAAGARKFVGSSWWRSIRGALAWPSYLPLIVISRLRHQRRRKAMTS